MGELKKDKHIDMKNKTAQKHLIELMNKFVHEHKKDYHGLTWTFDEKAPKQSKGDKFKEALNGHEALKPEERAKLVAKVAIEVEVEQIHAELARGIHNKTPIKARMEKAVTTALKKYVRDFGHDKKTLIKDLTEHDEDLKELLKEAAHAQEQKHGKAAEHTEKPGKNGKAQTPRSPKKSVAAAAGNKNAKETKKKDKKAKQQVA